MAENINILLSSSLTSSAKRLLPCGREGNSWKTKEVCRIALPSETPTRPRGQARVHAVYLYRRDNASKTLFHVRILGAVPLRAGTSSCNAQHPRVVRCIRCRALCSNIILALAISPSAFFLFLPYLPFPPSGTCGKFQMFVISLAEKYTRRVFFGFSAERHINSASTASSL